MPSSRSRSTTEDLRARLGRELDTLKETEDALYVSKRGRLAAVVLDSEHYSLAALTARDQERDATVPWLEVREPDA